uniref:E3 ubiquitin-protein ligase n=1 Tax=Heterorhabditis bacteriophora TaxID=37862 RepID=A0A1I7X646_HETBA
MLYFYDALVGGSQTGETKRIEMVLGDRALPSQMSILQAIRQYSPAVTEDHTGSIGNSLWMATHTLYYRSASGPSPPPQPLVPTPLINKEKKHRINEKVWQEGEVDTHLSPLWVYLHSSLPCGVDDPCVSSLLLIRALYGLNRHWHALFDDEPSLPTTYAPLLSGRQLSDFISVATQDIPEWTVNIVKAV